jgi:hypothetical protein
MRFGSVLVGIAVLGASALMTATRGQAVESAQEAEGPPIEVREGNLVNFVHRYYFPIGSWRLTGEPEADFQEMRHTYFEGAVLRVLVSTGNSDSLDDTARALREQGGEDARFHVLSETTMRVGVKEALDMVAIREGTPTEPLTVLRTLCFNRGGDKYYVRLEAPATTFEQASNALEVLVRDFKFEVRVRMPWKK